MAAELLAAVCALEVLKSPPGSRDVVDILTEAVNGRNDHVVVTAVHHAPPPPHHHVPRPAKTTFERLIAVIRSWFAKSKAANIA